MKNKKRPSSFLVGSGLESCVRLVEHDGKICLRASLVGPVQDHDHYASRDSTIFYNQSHEYCKTEIPWLYSGNSHALLVDQDIISNFHASEGGAAVHVRMAPRASIYRVFALYEGSGN